MHGHINSKIRTSYGYERCGYSEEKGYHDSQYQLKYNYKSWTRRLATSTTLSVAVLIIVCFLNFFLAYEFKAGVELQTQFYYQKVDILKFFIACLRAKFLKEKNCAFGDNLSIFRLKFGRSMSKMYENIFKALCHRCLFILCAEVEYFHIVVFL